MCRLQRWYGVSFSKHILQPLTIVIHHSFQTGVFLPQKLLKTKFNLKKRGKFATLVITDLSHICQFRTKYLKKSFVNRILNFLAKHKTVSSKLVGLRIGKSTLDADVSFVDTVGGECGVERESGDRRQGMQMCSGAVLCRKPHSAQLRLCLRLHLFRLSTVHQTVVKSILDRLVGR